MTKSSPSFRLHRTLLTQYNRTQKDVTKWLKQCENNEKNVNIDNLKDLDQTYTQFAKIKVIMQMINLASITFGTQLLEGLSFVVSSYCLHRVYRLMLLLYICPASEGLL